MLTFKDYKLFFDTSPAHPGFADNRWFVQRNLEWIFAKVLRALGQGDVRAVVTLIWSADVCVLGKGHVPYKRMNEVDPFPTELNEEEQKLLHLIYCYEDRYAHYQFPEVGYRLVDLGLLGCNHYFYTTVAGKTAAILNPKHKIERKIDPELWAQYGGDPKKRPWGLGT